MCAHIRNLPKDTDHYLNNISVIILEKFQMVFQFCFGNKVIWQKLGWKDILITISPHITVYMPGEEKMGEKTTQTFCLCHVFKAHHHFKFWLLDFCLILSVIFIVKIHRDNCGCFSTKETVYPNKPDKKNLNLWSDDYWRIYKAVWMLISSFNLF